MAGGKGFIAQTFTSNGNFVVPAGVTEVILIGCGGGAGGYGGMTYNDYSSAGGNGSVPTMRRIVVVPNTTYAVTIGTGGTGGAGVGAALSPGSSGTATTFGALATFDGAHGGANSYNTSAAISLTGSYPYPGFPTPGGFGGLSGAIGYRDLTGNVGTASGTKSGGRGGACGTTGRGGNGGNGNNSGAGGVGQTPSSTNFGAGGGSGGCGTSVGGAGGAGAPGFLQVIWVEG